MNKANTTPETRWADRLRKAQARIDATRGIEAQTIRDAHTSGMTETRIAAALGVKNRDRLRSAIRDTPDQAQPVALTPTVYLRGAGMSDATWERVHRAMWARGWATITDRTAAWHLARGGVPVVMCIFSARDIHDYVVVGAVQAKYRGDELALELPGTTDDDHPYGSYRQARPRMVDPAGRINGLGLPMQVTDPDGLARMVADALDGINPNGW